MMMLIVILVLCLLFGFVCYMASKTWRIPHVVLLFFVFLMSLVFMVLSSASLKTHQGWKKKHQDLVKQLEQQEKRLELLERGDVLVAEDDTESLPRVAGEFARLIVDRGRVWRNVKPAPAEGAIGLNMTGWGDESCLRVGTEDLDDDLEPIPDDGTQPAAPAAPATDHGMTAGMVVFGFLDLSTAQLQDAEKQALFGDESELVTADTQGMCRVPGFFAGSFRVDKVEGNSLALLPVLPLDDAQKNFIGKGQATWTIYEVMPVDSHEALAGMSEEAIRGLFAAQPQVAEDYVRDMSPAKPGDPDNRTMRKIKFLRDYEVSVDVDGEEPGIDKNFSPDGRAILSHLRQGEPTKFKAGDSPDVYFPTEVANRLRRDGICEFVDEQPLYVRPLRDYRYYFYQKNFQIEQLAELMVILTRENAAIQDTEAKARDQQKYRQDELVRLKDDRSHTEEELALLQRHRTGLEQSHQSQKSALGSLYQWNNQQADELRGTGFYGAGNR